MSGFASFGNTGALTSHRGQTFTPVLGGRLESVSIRIGRSGDHEGVIRVEVRSVNPVSGTPDAGVLATVDRPANDVPGQGGGPMAFDFSGTEVDLVKGETYAWVVYPVPLTAESSIFFLNGRTGEGATYAGGESVFSADGAGWNKTASDHGFEVQVEDMVPVEAVSWGSLKRRN